MEERELLDKLIETVFVNMYGEAARNDNIIDIGYFKPNLTTHKTCLRIAKSVAGLYGYKIRLGCGLFTYLKFLYNEGKLFHNNLYLWDRKNKGRAAFYWVADVSDAYHENMLIWDKVWEYLGGDE